MHNAMPETVSWADILVRLALTVLAGTLIGLNRSEHGRPAGLRTVLLVCLAASIAMIQMNLLLPTTGKTPESFGVMDMMRLPLGILSGVGFIGAGAILRRGNMVTGITTAATLWFVTVLGLCFGGGQIWLGLAALALGMIVLWVLRVAERFFKEEHDAVFILDIDRSGPSDDDLRAQLKAAGIKMRSYGLTMTGDGMRRRVRMEVRWKARVRDPAPPAVIYDLQQRPGVLYLNWRP